MTTSKWMMMLVAAVVLAMLTGGCGTAPSSVPPVTASEPVAQPGIILPTYTVLDEDVYDAPVKTQVSLKVLVSGEITESGLRALLEKLYVSTAARTGFKYHESPTSIFIHAFTSKERAESGTLLWVAMLRIVPGDSAPTIEINDRQLAQLGAAPEEKFGLSEATRKRIFLEIVKVEDKAYTEAERKYPLPDPLKPGYSQSAARTQVESQAGLARTLLDKYKDELAKRHGLTRNQLDEIGGEGVLKDWPFPPST